MRAWVDANVILRFLTGDPTDMAQKARTLLEAADEGRVVLVVEDIVVAEVVWVLTSYYGYPASKVATTLQELLSHDGMECADKPSLLVALHLFSEKKVDFADALLAARMAGQGGGSIFSFDRHFDRLPGVTRLMPGVTGN